MKNIFKKIFILIILVSFLVPSFVDAQVTLQKDRLENFENFDPNDSFLNREATKNFSGGDLQNINSDKSLNIRPAEKFLNIIIAIIYYIIPILITAAMVLFLYGLLKYVKASDTKVKDEAKKFIAYGIVALFIMFSFWGIVNAISNTLGVREGGTLKLEKNYGILP
jgi:hypothetical protein